MSPFRDFANSGLGTLSERGGTLSRRLFLALTGMALGMPRGARGATPAPPDLDHIIFGVDDLNRGITWLEGRTGVRAVPGGVHPGHGTRNALLSLGSRRYLEILAPDPKQPSELQPKKLLSLHEPRLVGWAVATKDIAACASRAIASGFRISGPEEGTRTRPDGKTLRWKTVKLVDDLGGLLPFFIEWSPDSVDPSSDAPRGCSLVELQVWSPDPSSLSKACQGLGVDVIVQRSERQLLRVRLACHQHPVELTS